MRNSELLNGLKFLFTIQYVVQWINIYGTVRTYSFHSFDESYVDI